MDHDSEIARFKGFVVVGILFLISGWYSQWEFRYAIWGQTAEARITRQFETREIGRRGPKRPVLVVEYSYTDKSGAQRDEHDRVPTSWQSRLAEVTTIQYLPGVVKSSRLLGHSYLLPVWFFLGTLGWLIYSVYRIYLEALEPARPTRRRSRSRSRQRE